MNLPNWLLALCRIVITVAVPILIIATPLYIFVTPGYVRHEYGLKGFPPSTRFDDAERLRLSDIIVGYLRGNATLDDMATMRTDEGDIAMRPEEVQHIVDVKVVTDGFFLAHRVALALGLLAAYVLWRASRLVTMGEALRQGLYVIVGLLVFIVLASLVDFEVFFTRFHQIFFQAGTWVFWVDDTLIQLYPLPLWMHAVWKIGVVALIEVAIVYGLTNWLRRYGA
jgi:integral membrane protein (TIGR01906 family)